MNKLSTFSHLNCIHFGACSGCSLEGAQAERSLLLDEVEQEFSNFSLKNFEFKRGEMRDWRIRAKLAVQGTPGDLLIGLYQEGTHRVLPIPHCQVHHPSLNPAIATIKNFLDKLQIIPYCETSGQGFIRYLQLTVERASGKVELVLVLNRNGLNEPESDFVEKLQELWEMGLWHSIWLNFQTSRANAIFGASWHRCCGPSFLWQPICGIDAAFQPATFMQANLAMFELLINDLKTFVPQRATVAEYYAGVGVIGIALSSQCRKITCCEWNPHVQRCFEESYAKLPLEQQAKLTFVTAPVQDKIELLEDAEVIIVDPPRKGMEKKLLHALGNAPPSVETLCYISCGWKGFKEDSSYLLQKGWRLHAARAYLFFPGTNHLEILAVFKRER